MGGVLTVRVGCQTKDRKTAKPRDGKFRRAGRNEKIEGEMRARRDEKVRKGFL